jgi:lipoprotein-releasing system permease protein
MSRLPFEAFLALRYLRPRRTFVSVITLISIVGVLLGVAVLIIVIAVMSGFDKQWRDSILGFNAHITVSPIDRNNSFTNYQAAMKLISTNADVIGTTPFIHSQVLVKTEPESGEPIPSALYLAGVDPATVGKVNVLPASILPGGAFDLSDKGLVIGCDYAKFAHLEVGDRVAIWSWKSLQKMDPTTGKTNTETTLAEDFTVRGIFDVGFDVFNSQFIVASLEDTRDLLAMPDNAVQAVQVKLRDPFQADEVAGQLRAVLPNGYMVQTWQDDPSSVIFNALATEKEMMFYILFFIMIVAAFGIINCQITFVVQKTREIGILKALGATNRQVLLLFLSQSVIVGVLGVGLGLAAAMLALHYRNEFLGFMRHATQSELLPAAIYHVYELPASIQTPDVVRICGTAFAACVLAGLFPAWKASRLQPVEALRHE